MALVSRAGYEPLGFKARISKLEIRNNFECPRTKIRNGLILRIARLHLLSASAPSSGNYQRRSPTSRTPDRSFGPQDLWEQTISKPTRHSVKKTSFCGSRFAEKSRKKVVIGCDC